MHFSPIGKTNGQPPSLGSRIYHGVGGFFGGAFFGAMVQGVYLGQIDEASRGLLWIGPVVGIVVGVLLGVTIGHFEFRGRTRRVTLGIFAGFIIGIFVGAIVAGKSSAVDEAELDLLLAQYIRLGAILGPLLGGIIGFSWNSRRNSIAS